LDSPFLAVLVLKDQIDAAITTPMARQTDENLRQFVNDYGLIDLIKAGCTEQKMVA
jgi:hypothetical protein